MNNMFNLQNLMSLRSHKVEYFSAVLMRDLLEKLFNHVVLCGIKKPLEFNVNLDYCTADIVENVCAQLKELGFSASVSGSKYTVEVVKKVDPVGSVESIDPVEYNANFERS